MISPELHTTSTAPQVESLSDADIRAELNAMVKKYAERRKDHPSTVWGILFSAIEDANFGKFKIGIFADARRENIRPLDLVARKGLLHDALRLARDIFR